jgi:hypothetical protein
MRYPPLYLFRTPYIYATFFTVILQKCKTPLPHKHTKTKEHSGDSVTELPECSFGTVFYAAADTDINGKDRKYKPAV